MDWARASSSSSQMAQRKRIKAVIKSMRGVIIWYLRENQYYFHGIKLRKEEGNDGVND